MIQISGFTDEVNGSLDTQIAVAKSLGMHYICPRVIDGKNISAYTCDEFLQTAKPRLDAAGIGFSSIGSPIGKVGIGDEEGYQAQRKKLKELVKIATAMNCKYIRIFSFFVSPKIDYEKAHAIVLRKLKGFLEEVEGTDIVLLHENEKKIYGDTPERALRLYREIDHPQFKLCYDASYYIQCKVDPVKAFEMTKEATVYYHMKDCDRGVEVPLGTGKGHIKELLADLVKRGYDGFLTLEPHTAKYAVLKHVFLFVPGLAFTTMGKVFRTIDRSMGVGTLQKVSREQVFVWQHDNLTKMLDEVGGQYE